MLLSEITEKSIYMLQPHIIAKHNGTKAVNICLRRIIMLSFLKKIFGAKPAEKSAVPYKVEEPSQFPFPKVVKEAKPARAKKPAAKKPAAKKASKPKTPKA